MSDHIGREVCSSLTAGTSGHDERRGPGKVSEFVGDLTFSLTRRLAPVTRRTMDSVTVNG